MTKRTPKAASQAEEGRPAERLASFFQAHDGSVRLATGPLESDVRDWLDTGLPMLNYIMGRDGVPGGRVITIFGKEGSCKSTLACTILAHAQKKGAIAILVDAERTFDPVYGASLGLDTEDLLVSYPNSVEETFGGVFDDKGGMKRPGVVKNAIEQAQKIDSNIPVVIVVDSLAALTVEDKANGGSSKQPGLVAKYMSEEFKLLVPQLAKAHATLIIINQLRHHLEMNAMRTPERRKVMGSEWGMPAEQSLIFFSSLMLYMQATGVIRDEKKEVIGQTVRVTVAKEKVGPGEGRTMEFDLLKDGGIDVTAMKLELLMELKVITQDGSWYKYGDHPAFRASAFDVVLETYPELEEIVRAAPTAWERGGPQPEADE